MLYEPSIELLRNEFGLIERSHLHVAEAKLIGYQLRGMQRHDHDWLVEPREGSRDEKFASYDKSFAARCTSGTPASYFNK